MGPKSYKNLKIQFDGFTRGLSWKGAYEGIRGQDRIGIWGHKEGCVDMGGWRGGAMISPPTHCPRPFHLRPRPQLDFFRITRIRKSCGMIFLVWTTFHTWCRFDNSFSLNTHHAYDVECIAMNRWYQANELVIMDMKHHFQVWSGT